MPRQKWRDECHKVVLHTGHLDLIESLPPYPSICFHLQAAWGAQPTHELSFLGSVFGFTDDGFFIFFSEGFHWSSCFVLQDSWHISRTSESSCQLWTIKHRPCYCYTTSFHWGFSRDLVTSGQPSALPSWWWSFLTWQTASVVLVEPIEPHWETVSVPSFRMTRWNWHTQ